MRKAVVALLVTSIIVLAGLLVHFYAQSMNPGAGRDLAETPAATAGRAQTAFTKPTVTADPVRSRVAAMTLEQKIGQMVIAGIDGVEIDEHALLLIRQHGVGGVILYGANVQDPAQLLNLVSSLKKANKGNVAPLFLSVDQEGGRIDRMPGELRRLPPARAVGQTGDAGLAFGMYRAIAREIGAFGFNLDFAPVLDIDSNPDNPVIGDRSFGADAGVVGHMGVQAMKGLQAGGVIPAVKHFPGHGDTSVDSHVGLPVLDHDLDRLRGFELLPFRQAIENGADVVLTAHILLPRIDGENPASFSKTIITDVLRGELGFAGVVITDDMTMGAVVENYDIVSSSVKAILAGSDIVLVAHDFELEVKVIDGLKQAVTNGELSMERIDESVSRILRLKEKYLLTDHAAGSIDVDAINRGIDEALDGFPAETAPSP